jgi:predicted SnoaL-like aldol condensation-catalyzing enzyme
MIRTKRQLAFLGWSAFILACTPILAQEPVTGVADPQALFTSPDPKLHANKQVVLHIVRDLLEAGHWSEAPKYLTQRYIQHNPNVASGLAPVMKFFSGMPSRPIPERNNWRTKVVAVVAEADLVVVATVRELPRRREQGKTYTTTWFDMWRIKDGKADEHWDGATINATPPASGRGAASTPPTNPAVASQAVGTNNKARMSMSNLPPPVQMTAEQDHQRMMRLLGITALRPGPSGDPKAPNAANTDESRRLIFN